MPIAASSLRRRCETPPGRSGPWRRRASCLNPSRFAISSAGVISMKRPLWKKLPPSENVPMRSMRSAPGSRASSGRMTRRLSTRRCRGAHRAKGADEIGDQRAGRAKPGSTASTRRSRAPEAPPRRRAPWSGPPAPRRVPPCAFAAAAPHRALFFPERLAQLRRRGPERRQQPRSAAVDGDEEREAENKRVDTDVGEAETLAGCSAASAATPAKATAAPRRCRHSETRASARSCCVSRPRLC